MKISSQKPIVLFLITFVFLPILFVCISLTQALTANAQDNSDRYFATTTNANCSDYYNFNGVEIDIKPNIIQSMAGSEISFFGYILNNNKYPIVDGKLVVKIFRDRKVKDSNGPDVLDTFVVRENISLNAGEKLPIEFKWKIPANGLGGNYKLATYFITSGKFNLAGLSFTDDVVGSMSSFKVAGQLDTGVYFKKDGIKINDKPYFVATYPPIESAIDPVTILVPVINTTKERQIVQTEFNVYKWDAQTVENKIDSALQMVIVEPGKIIYVPITVRDTASSVYYIEAVLKYKDSKSMVGIRFVRDGVVMPRINFPSVVSYPLVAGKENKIFACFHNASNSNMPVDGKLKIEILSEDDNSAILTYEYNGKIVGDMGAVVQNFTPKETYKNFKIHASLFSGEKLVDEVYVPYKCSLIDPKKCSSFSLEEITSNKLLILLMVILGVVVILIVIICFRIKKKNLLGISKNTIKTFIFMLLFASVFCTNSNTYAAAAPPVNSGSGSSGSGCFTVSAIAPTSSTTCNLWGRGVAEANKCSVNNKVRASITGTNLTNVSNINIASYPASIISQSPLSMIIEFERLSGEWTQNVNFYDKSLPLLATCKASVPFAFVCQRPVITFWQPLKVSTDVSELITLTGQNFNNVQSVKLENKTIDQTKFTSRSDTEITFMSPKMTAGFKDLALNSVCMKKEFDTKNDVWNNAIEYVKDPDLPKPPVQPPFRIWSISDGYNEGQSVATSSDLYYWATTSATTTGDLAGGVWATALSNASAAITYDSSITYSDGVVVQPEDSIPVGTVLNFNFDGNSTTSSSNIFWSGTGFTQDTPYGSWIPAADYPAQVCTSANWITKKTYTNPSTNVTKDIDVYIPLSVNPPSTELSFVDATRSPIFGSIFTFPQWGAPAYPANDTAGWSCISSTVGSKCLPLNTGTKTVYMYYSPTYGYYYYGWKYSDAPNKCYTNDIPLNEKVSMLANNGSASIDQNYTTPCTPGTATCVRRFRNSSGDIVGCSTTYPYYNIDSNKCYATLTDFNNSLHLDPNVSGSNVLTDYYSNYKLKFRESVYKIALNITASTTVRDRVPFAPTVTGPTTVYVNVPADYTAVSTLDAQIAKEKSNSMLGSIIIAIKRVFATAADADRVEYQIDWNNDDIPEESSSLSEIVYGTPFDFSQTWAVAGSVTFKVRAKDYLSKNLSDWTSVPVNVVLPQEGSLDKPVLSGTYCGTDLTLSWNRINDADGYTINRNSTYFAGVDRGDTLTGTYTGYTQGSPFYMYAYKNASTSVSSVTSIIPPDTWTPRAYSRNWQAITSSSDGTKLAAVVYGGYIYTSTDGGVTWATSTGSVSLGTKDWRSITSDSNTGTNLIAVVRAGQIYKSTDSGVTWSVISTSPVMYWQSVTSSSNGLKLVAVVSNGQIYTSLDNGNTWKVTVRSSAAYWSSVASNSLGNSLVAAVNYIATVNSGGKIYTSTIPTSSWTVQTLSPTAYWESVASDSTGAKLAAVAKGGYIYTSTDYGVNWTARGEVKDWKSITSSSDGTKLVAGVGGPSGNSITGKLYASTDSGETWNVINTSPTANWVALASSADGNKITALSYGGSIYTSQYESTTTISTITTATTTSSSSDPYTPTEYCASSTAITTASIDGVRFFANPPWARSPDNKCQLFGSASSTITVTSGGSVQTLLNTTTSDCKVDNTGSIFNLGSSISSIGYFNVGKHVLSCSVSYNKEVGSTTVYTSTFSGVETKCSQVPKVIEK